jgi:hypothetical protein
MHSFPICEALQDRLGFSGVASDHVPDVLPAYKSILMNAVDRSDGENAWPDLVEQLCEGYWQLWVTPHSAAITTIREQGQFNVCVIIYAGGVLKDIIECVPGVMEWARAMGCQKMHIEGRKGWGPALKEFGAELRYHVYSVEL